MTENHPPNELSMTVRTNDGDKVRVSFSDFEKGSSVIKVLMYLTSPESLESIVSRFAASGDPSMAEFIPDQDQLNDFLAHLPVEEPESAPPADDAPPQGTLNVAIEVREGQPDAVPSSAEQWPSLGDVDPS